MRSGGIDEEVEMMIGFPFHVNGVVSDGVSLSRYKIRLESCQHTSDEEERVERRMLRRTGDVL
jgi:hypothetical protein